LHEQPPASGRPPLTDMQASRLDFARRDLENFRAVDLTELDAAGLTLIVARLLTRLDDALQIVDEALQP
jgi:hypothetical protein